MIRVFLTLALLALASPTRASTVMACQDANGSDWPVSPQHPCPFQGVVAAPIVVPLDVATVTTGGTAVTALAVGHASAGGFLVSSNAAGICINQQGVAGTSTSSGTVCVAPNQVYTLVPSANAVSVNSTGSAVAIGGEGFN